jgi:DNA-binding SARP family transcriptional activator
MRCHLAIGCAADAAADYLRMRQLFAAVLGIKPSAESERLHASAVAGADATQSIATTARIDQRPASSRRGSAPASSQH